MNLTARKTISGLCAGAAAIAYAALFSAPYEVAPNGTIESGGIGRAVEMLFIGALVYAIFFFGLARLSKPRSKDTP